MTSRNHTLNSGMDLNYSPNPSGSGPIEFQLSDADGQQIFGNTDLRATGTDENEVFAGATVLGNGNCPDLLFGAGFVRQWQHAL
jgi:hypothetical protein